MLNLHVFHLEMSLLFFESCELPLDVRLHVELWQKDVQFTSGWFQAALCSLFISQWQQMCSSLKITFEEVLTSALTVTCSIGRDLVIRGKRDTSA